MTSFSGAGQRLRGGPRPTKQPVRQERSYSSPIYVDSDDDDMEEVQIQAGPSRSSGGYSNGFSGTAKLEPNYGESTTGDIDPAGREALRVALAKLDFEIKSVQTQLEPLQQLYSALTAERRELEAQLNPRTNARAGSSKGPQRQNDSVTDYQSSSFPWRPAVLGALKQSFGLKSFRLCQEGVINAAMDGRDIVCVMPTGGGKSLTYQLPAVAGAKGLTVVISPLLALIWDQVRGLKELGVECAMITGATSKYEQNELYRRIREGGSREQKELKMCYVTPEKIAKSKQFMGALQNANDSGRLKRFVIDEAHCCSQMGHDFRPDYKNLSVLKSLFPRVPIQAVTATLSSKTLPDLLTILKLRPITDGREANGNGTVFFSAPLFRPNLHYKVLPKPASAKAAIERMGKFILDTYPISSGIIYCFSQKDADTVSEELRTWSNGKIKTGAYHAGIDDEKKERIHVEWRQGKINCICATIAFGLGIDKGDVRYVIHHSMSKSLDGYYQETGRAGRDGLVSDCILFYRGQDASRLSSLTYSKVDGTGKLHEMLRFAQDLRTCRKVAFAKYFSASASLSAAAWDTSDSLTGPGGSVTTCGICDNCLRDPDSIITKDVTVECWKILRVLKQVMNQGGRVTLSNLATVVRGLGGASFSIPSQGGKRKAENETGSLELDKLIGTKVNMSKDDVEALMIHMTLLGYLEESFAATSYTTNVYVEPGRLAIRLSRLTLNQIEDGAFTNPIECTFVNAKAKSSSRRGAAAKKVVEIDSGDDDDIDDDDLDEDEDGGHEIDGPKSKQAKKTNSPKPKKTAKSGTSKKAVARPRGKKGDPVEDAAVHDTLNFIRGVGRKDEGQGMPASGSKARAPVQREKAKTTGKQQEHAWTDDDDDDDDDDSDDIEQVNGWKVIGGRSRLDVG